MRNTNNTPTNIKKITTQ